MATETILPSQTSREYDPTFLQTATDPAFEIQGRPFKLLLRPILTPIRLSPHYHLQIPHHGAPPLRILRQQTLAPPPATRHPPPRCYLRRRLHPPRDSILKNALRSPRFPPQDPASERDGSSTSRYQAITDVERRREILRSASKRFCYSVAEEDV